MSQNAVLSGQFADFKLVRTRGVAQVIVEVPLEQAGHVFEMFGVPSPSEDIWVAVARMNTKSTPARGLDGGGVAPQGVRSRTFNDMPRAQQAGILCDDYEFTEFVDERALNRQKVMGDALPDTPADAVREWCGVKSRSELNEGRAAPVWDALVREFRGWQTERRYT